MVHRARPRIRVIHRRLLPILALALAAACGGSSSGEEPMVDVGAPSVSPRDGGLQTLEPFVTPPPTPTPTPGPTPTPLPPPGGATIRAEAGTQSGRSGGYCWSAQEGGPSECYEGRGGEPAPIPVRMGETVLLVIDSRSAPDEESIRAFRGRRSDYPAQRIEPAQETELTIDLEPGDWSLDLCAAWNGHGEPICWLFRLDVAA